MRYAMTGKDKAKQLYENGCKYKDIAEQLDISINTVKSWRTREKWKRKKGATKDKKVAPIIKKVAPKVAPKQLSKQQPTDDKWKQFSLLYLQCFNATQAYMKTYNVDYETAMANASRLLRNAKVKSYLDELRQAQSQELYVSVKDILEQELKIAYGNIGDYLTVKTIKQERLDADGTPVVDVDGKPIIDEYNRFVVTDPDKVDWSIVQEAHTGKDGLVVKLYDKHKALSELLKRLPDADEARIAKSKADMLDTDNNEEMSQMEMLLSKLKDDSMKDEE
ncbi:terminase small subunit [Apilactobacillus kunkeei]|uniref:terminase small subunit n=1 Tax=Apilactobacillus kunkeei TaxID=148814 RepID=UPI00200ABCFD|nr:terminase small subunit [Apilactobacillus kunkeei]